MTPIEEADLAQRRWLRLQLAGTGGFVALLLVGILIIAALKAVVLGFAVIVIALVARLVLGFSSTRIANHGLPSTHHDSTAEAWWYDNRTGEVSRGSRGLDAHHDGPFATREDAARAPEIARSRAANWNAED